MIVRLRLVITISQYPDLLHVLDHVQECLSLVHDVAQPLDVAAAAAVARDSSLHQANDADKEQYKNLS